MASSTSITAGTLLLLLLFPATAQALGLTVTVENEFVTAGKALDVHCTLNKQDLGKHSLMPFNRFEHHFYPGFFGRDVFTCTFAAAGKPTTTIDVFKGYTFSSRPCECVGIEQCFWQVLNEGFWCNSKFIQTWRT